MKIANFDLEKRVFIVAEIGNNHEGNFSLAKEMIYKAKEAGADAVKFQTFKTEKYVAASEVKRFKQLKGFEFSYEQFKKLSELSKKCDLIFLSTPFDLESVSAISPLVPAFKISSGDNTFLPLIERVALEGKPIILSTGLLNDLEIKKILKLVQGKKNLKTLKERVALLHCVCSYPVPDKEINLLSIKYLQDKFGLVVGYSDHSLGITACIAAVALGARIIEKHFTYRKENQDFKDHLLSAEPNEFREMTKQIRDTETFLGNYKKGLMPCEEKLIKIVRRSLAANNLIRKGQIIESGDITWVRPASGLQPELLGLILGKRASRDIRTGEIFCIEDVG